MEELFAGRNVDIPAMKRRMKALMEQEGLPYGERTSTFNSRLAQELAKWAEGQPDGDRIHDAIFRAYFVDGKNLGKVNILLQLVEQVGLPGSEARRVLDTRSYKDAVDADWERCSELGVTGVPTFMMNGFRLVGAQPYEELERFVLRAKSAANPGKYL